MRTAVVAAIRRAARRDLARELIEAAGRDAEPVLRAAAFEALGSLGVPEAVPVALDGLTDPEDEVRSAAIGVLGSLGGPEVVPRLRERTADPEAGVRAAAARALGLLRAGDAAPDFLRLLRDPRPEAREAGAHAAAGVRVAGAIPGLIELLGDDDSAVRQAAVQGLGRLSDPAAVPALVRAFDAADSAMREAIVEAVSHIDVVALEGLIDVLVASEDTAGKLGAIRTLRRLPPAAAGAALDGLSQDPEPAVRAAAIGACGRVGGEEARVAVAAGLHDPDDEVRAAALDAASRMQLHGQGRSVLGLLEHDPSPRVRERAALATGLLVVAGGEAGLLAACRRPEPMAVRAAAALATGAFEQDSIVARVVEMGDEAAVRAHLRERLKHDAAYRLLGRKLSTARHLELRALGARTTEAAERALGDGMRSILDAGERIRLISGLRALQGDQSRGALLQVIRGDPSPEVRTAALTAVGGLLDDDGLLEVAGRALGDPSLLVRRAAVVLFARIPPERGLPRLLQTLHADDDPAVLASVAELAEAAFDTFVDLALGMPRDGHEAVLVAHIARYVHHHDLPRLLPVMARSGAPAVREAIATLWRHRPDVVDLAGLEALTMDPVVSVRREAAGAAGGVESWPLLSRMAEDPDAEVRREVAVAIGAADQAAPAAIEILARLADDQERTVRAAAYIGRLLQGTPVPLPPDLDPRAAGVALRRVVHLSALRETARTAPGEDRRLSAALALALLEDEVAHEVARHRPGPGHSPPGERRPGPRRRGAGGHVKDTIIQVLIVVTIVAQPIFLFYFLLYNTYTLSLIVILSARQVRRRVAGHFIEDLDLIDRGRPDQAAHDDRPGVQRGGDDRRQRHQPHPL